MNKRYIDFVPAKSTARQGVSSSSTIQVVMPASKAVPKSSRPSQPSPSKRPTARSSRPQHATSSRTAPRPTSSRTTKAPRPTAKPVTSPRPARATPALGVIEDLNPKFVNTNVPKRPLNQADAAKLPPSRRLHHRPLQSPTSTTTNSKSTGASATSSSTPVTIITKPQKDSRAGLIVTIIITIILGAATGTVAFLLLPK